MRDRIVRKGLCMGCGLCGSVLEQPNAMKVSKEGFYEPDTKEILSANATVRSVCPGISIHGHCGKDVWGQTLDVVEAWSADEQIRHHSSSGGIVTSLAIWMIENRKADAVLHVGVKADDFLHNELQISRSREDVFKNAQSRYAPALTLHRIKQILDTTDESFVFIGKPCDIAGIRNMTECFPEYKERFRLLISIFCAGIPSYEGSKDVCRQLGREDAPVRIQYRGDGWPGNFKAEWADGDTREMSYNDSWGKILGRKIAFRCKVCPDGIGLLADLAVGDSWNTKDGYPDFNDDKGRSFVMIRTTKGQTVFNEACRTGSVVSRPLGRRQLQSMQPFQYHRRLMAGWRLIPLKMMNPRLLDFSGLGLVSMIKQSPKRKGIREMLGTMKRIIKRG